MPSPALATRLQDAGIGPTPQRLRIAKVLLSAPRHLSADQVLAAVNRKGSIASKATVYNTLRLFTKRNLLREVVVDPHRILYDSCVTPHHHFYNPATSELTDIPAAAITMSRLPPTPAGTEADGVEVIVRLRKRSAV